MIKTLCELVDQWDKIPEAMERMLSKYKNMTAFDHCITIVGQRFLITIIIEIPHKK